MQKKPKKRTLERIGNLRLRDVVLQTQTQTQFSKGRFFFLNYFVIKHTHTTHNTHMFITIQIHPFGVKFHLQQPRKNSLAIKEIHADEEEERRDGEKKYRVGERKREHVETEKREKITSSHKELGAICL